MSAPESNPTSTGEKLSHYEKPQVPGRPFVIGVIGFFALMTLIFGVVWVLAGTWTHGGRSFREPPSPPSADPRWTMQSPQLQIDPEIDLQKLRQIEYQRLHTIKWSDGTHAYVNIPIEDAMQLLGNAAAQGRINSLLPAPQPATPLDLQNQKSREAATPEPHP